MIHVRVPAEVKSEAAKTLASMGLTVSGAVRLLLTRVAADRAFPFELRGPNEQSRQAIAEMDAGRGRRFATVADLMADLHEDD